NHTRNRNISRSAEQMCYQDSQMYLSPEEAAAAEESLATYCKPVEFYNILQRRALRHPLFLQRCLHYKIQAKRRRRIKMTITFSGFVKNEVQGQNVFPLYVLVSSPISDSPEDSAVYRSSHTCLLKVSTQLGCNEKSAVSFILPEIGKLSEDVVTDNLTILFVCFADHSSFHGENSQICSLANYSGHVLWGKLPMGSLCDAWESSVSLKLGNRADMISSVDLNSSILEHARKENGNDHLIFKAHNNSNGLNALMRLQVDISAQELGPRENSPYDSYSYSDIPSSLLSRIIRMRAGNVIFNYKYYNNKLRKTEVTEDFTCPFCLVRCSSFQGLRHHLTCSHDLFNFAFWVNEEFQTVDVSLKTEIWRYEGNIADEDGNVAPFKAFSYCSRSCSVKRRRAAVRDSAYSHHQVKQLDSLGTMSFGQYQNALTKIAPVNSHEASVEPFLNGIVSLKEPSSARIVYDQSPGGTISELQNSTEQDQGSGLAPSSPAREDRPQLADTVRVDSKEETDKQGILGDGEIALPSQRDETENAYMEQVCAGDSMVAEIQVSVANSVEYGPQTDASILNPPSTLRFGKTRKLSVEGGEPRSRLLLKKRQFFHSHRAQPMALEQVFSDRDSEDEVDDDIADFEDRRMLDDFVDVTKYEKQLMHLWNSFVRKQRVLADGHVPWACEAFSKHHGQDLARFPPLR
ncbi:hypothetical protein KI387_005562, partial [Taxus chinensis]